jgi:hypothetical protein
MGMQLTTFDELASRNDSISKIHGAKMNLDGGATFCCNLFDGVGAAANSGPLVSASSVDARLVAKVRSNLSPYLC